MPTRDEKVAQIEAALRSRFFSNVPKIVKPGREGWTEERHDDDRLSRALAAYALVGQCEVDDAIAVGAITDGSDDGGCHVEQGRRVDEDGHDHQEHAGDGEGDGRVAIHG